VYQKPGSLFCLPFGTCSTEPIQPPTAKKVSSSYTLHGVEIHDDYAWLKSREDDKPQDIIDHLEAENAYVEGTYCLLLSNRQNLTLPGPTTQPKWNTRRRSRKSCTKICSAALKRQTRPTRSRKIIIITSSWFAGFFFEIFFAQGFSNSVLGF
jgi:hypothetical protein